jgi:chromosome segregation ATPase
MTNTIITNGESAAILADNKRLRRQLAEAQAAATMWKTGADNMARECERLKQEYAGLESQRDAIEEALLNVQLQGVEIRGELEAAKKVADAAEKLVACDTVDPVALFIKRQLEKAIREYRANAEPLSPGKREVIDAAIEKVGDIETMQKTN